MPTQKTSWKKFFNSRWFLVFAILLMAFSSFVFFRAFYYDYKISREINELQEEVTRLESEKLETIELLNYSKSDNFIEEKARLELNMVKPGEKMMVVEPTSLPLEESERDVVELEKQSNIKKWWYYFFENN